MNREMKRRMRREEKQQQKGRGARPPVPPPGGKRQRPRIRQFIREIQGEMRRVIWPSSNEVFTYSFVVIIVVTLLTGIVFLLDLGFAQGVVELFRPAGSP